MSKYKDKVFMSAPHMGGTELEHIKRAFKENFIIPLGPCVDEFEGAIENFLGANEEIYAVAMNSGTSAIHIALKLLDIKQGEEIFCSSATFVATANPILYEKAKPVFIDSEEETWNICPKSLEKAILEKKKQGKVPRVLIVVDLFGTSANYSEICKICEANNIEIIEDAAEALGASHNGKMCGIFGKYGVLSFNGNKIITTSGGGALIVHTKEEAQRALFLITQAREDAPYYLHTTVGYNYRMSNICAAIGLGQMEVLKSRVEKRRDNYNFYRNKLAGLPVKFVTEKENNYSNRWITVILLPEDERFSPSDLISTLANDNIEARRVWKPLHSQPLFNDSELYSLNEISIAQKIFDYGVCLPSGSSLSDEELRRTSEIILKYFNERI